ncbi:MAG TPA: anti-sigma factor [Actinomycetota bacterium]|nr:anti-sigma factor [Actinomycetota bacterium]
MSWDHERVEELLAGRALGGLDPEDAALAERALLEHVPECERCRRALDGFATIAGDLALVAPPVAPPETLLPRLRRSARLPSRRRWSTAWVVAGALAVVLAGASGWSLVTAVGLSARLEEAEIQTGWLVDAVSTATHPSHEVLALTGGGEERVSVLFVPGDEHSYLMATNLPDPRFGYHVWFLGQGKTWHAGRLEVTHGWGMMPVDTNPDQWEVVMLTDEPRGGGPRPEASPLVSARVTA